jgi:hypothetical protein
MLVGFAVAPIAAVLVSVASYETFWHMGVLPYGGPIHSLDAAGAVGFGAAILAVIMTFTTAVPGVLWLNRTGWLTFGNVVLFGAVAGNLPFVLIAIIIVAAQLLIGTSGADIARFGEGLSGTFVRSAMGAIAGGVAAAAFWLVSMCGAAAAPLEPR